MSESNEIMWDVRISDDKTVTACEAGQWPEVWKGAKALLRRGPNSWYVFSLAPSEPEAIEMASQMVEKEIVRTKKGLNLYELSESDE